MGKTLGIGSFGKVLESKHEGWPLTHAPRHTNNTPRSHASILPRLPPYAPRLCAWLGQVKMAEHALTGHKVAIKILNRKKIKAMDMDEKGAHSLSEALVGR